MQRKYNMALQHFYQAAVTKNSKQLELFENETESEDEEEELFTNEHYKEECFEMEDANKGKPQIQLRRDRKNDRKAKVKQIQPKTLCSWRGCSLICLVFLLFIISVCTITYIIQLAIQRIKPNVKEAKKHFISYNISANVSTQTNRLNTCSGFTVKKLWHKKFDKFQSESATRLVDVNQDGVDDIIQGFGTSLASLNGDDSRDVCSIYYNNYPCFGGTVALDGKTGNQLWIHYSQHKIFGINCNGDLDMDGIADCLCSGKHGVFEAVSGATGSVIWMFLDSNHLNDSANLYTAQFVNDLNDDNIMDILQMHGGDSETHSFGQNKQVGHIMIFSGRDGKVLQSLPIPDGRESYFSPLVYRNKDGAIKVVFGTGSENEPGGLYVITLDDLYEGNLENSIEIAKGSKKGFITPPVLADINGDGTVDLVCATLNKKVLALDGENFDVIWTYETMESYSIPGVGYYNQDNVVDFFIRTNSGPGFPEFYDSQVVILNGIDGTPLTKKFHSSTPTYSSPLTVSMEGVGNDLFLYWAAECTEHEHIGGVYEFVPGIDIRLSSNFDTCKGRFGTKGFTSLKVMNFETGFPGKEIYNSAENSSLELYDDEVQKVLQTGSIASSTLNNEKSNKFDAIFSTWAVKQPVIRFLRQDDILCVKGYRKNAKNDKNVNIAMNKKNDFYHHGDSAVDHCLKSRYNDTILDDLVSAYNKNFNMGSMTVHRYEITCECNDGKTCGKVLPKQEQGWTGYMGSMANGYFKNRKHFRLHL